MDGDVNERAARVPVTIEAAARALGIKKGAVRRRIESGELEAIRIDGRQHVYLPAAERSDVAPTEEAAPAQPPAPKGETAISLPAAPPIVSADLSPLFEELRALRQRNEEMAGQLGYLQRVLQEKEEQLRLLGDSRQQEIVVEPVPIEQRVVAAAGQRVREWVRKRRER